MNAVILAAGKGTRLGNITNQIPKPMIKYSGKPILEHNILLCKKYGIEHIHINLHHLPHKIIDYIGNGSKYDLKISYHYEKKILGTAGSLISFFHHLRDNGFYLIYGDNYTNTNLLSLFNFHKKNNSDFTIAMHKRENISSSGVLEFQRNYKLTKFIEKPLPDQTKSKWVNSGVYFINPQIIEKEIGKGIDFGNNIIPNLIKSEKRIFGFKLNKEVISVDTPELLKKNTN